MAQEIFTSPDSRPVESIEPSGTESVLGNNISTTNGDCAAEAAVLPKPSHSLMSSEQFTILQDMIQQVLVQVQPTQSSYSSVSATATSTTKASSSPHTRAPYRHQGAEASAACVEASQFSKSIDELLRLPQKGTALFSEHAQLMIRSLDGTLAATEPHTETEQSNLLNQKRKRVPEDDDFKEAQTVRSVKRIRGQLNSTQCIAVNQPGKISKKDEILNIG